MKLLQCIECMDIVKLPPNGEPRPCACGKSRGRYVDDDWAHYSGPARILGMGNGSMRKSLFVKSVERNGKAEPRYEWWVIPEGRHIKEVEKV